MFKKPWPILILAGIHILEPAFKLVFYAWYWHISIAHHYSILTTNLDYKSFLFFFSFPICGIAIFAIKKWSLPVFLFMEFINLIGHIYSRYQHPGFFSLPLILGFSLMNILVVTYFLVPAVRLVYTHPKLRWWEAKPRYRINWSARITLSDRSFVGCIMSISENGVFLQEALMKVSQEETLSLCFNHMGYSFKLKGTVVHYFENAGLYHYGVKFSPLSRADQKKLKNSLKMLEHLGVDRYPKRGIHQSFMEWGRVLVTSGEGLFPATRLQSVKKMNIDYKKAS